MSREQYEVAGGPDLPKETNPDQIGTALEKINVTAVVLKELRKGAEALPVPKTKEEYEAIRRYRLDMVPIRTKTVKVLKEMREDAIAFQKLVKGKEDEITGDIAGSEEICAKKEQVWLDAQEAIRAEKERIERERVKVLFDQLKAYDWPGNEIICAQYTPDEFAAELDKTKANWETVQEAKRVEAERIEREAKERAEAEERNRAEAERLRKQQEALDAERRKLDEEKARALKEIEDAKQKAIAEENARIAEENRKERERLDAERAAIAAKEAEEARQKALAEEAARLAAQAPDREKIKLFAAKLSKFITDEAPTIGDTELNTPFTELVGKLGNVLDAMKELG